MLGGLHIQTEEIERKIILRLDGRLDAASSSILDRKINQLIEESHSHIALDFTRVDYLSSSGMRVLLAATKKLKSAKGCLILFSLSPEVAELISLAGFDKILHTCSTEKEAIQYILTSNK
ncbi:MAG TPA: STAS domain-containing protein [Chlamydiales bacterium]|jgi:anti-anti-sigma factor|nr:STAS domain-containing protein [Chlamydiales bacterium]